MFTRNTLLASSVALVLSSAAVADHPDVDIDELDATIVRRALGWTLEVEYEIEVEDYYSRDPLLLLLQPLERDRPLYDRHGRPIEWVIPLDRPTEIDDDEMEFEERISLDMPLRSIRSPDRLRLQALVIDPRTDRVLDRDRTSVDCDAPRRMPLLKCGTGLKQLLIERW